jgi:hypothetical protein
MRYLYDFATWFVIVFRPYIYVLMAGMMIASLLVTLLEMVTEFIRRKTL